jgi:hypothetical protein
MCWRCHVRQRCLDSALEAGAVSGVWGGTSERIRRRMRKTVAKGVAAKRGVFAGIPNVRQTSQPGV